MAGGSAKSQDSQNSVSNLMDGWKLSETLGSLSFEDESEHETNHGGTGKNSSFATRTSSGGPRVRKHSRRSLHEASLIDAFDIPSDSYETSRRPNREQQVRRRDSKIRGLNSTVVQDSYDSVEEPRNGVPQFPNLGGVLSGFRILMELGRGAFARVYLAEETNLASRLVAIKVSKAEGEEPQTLAKLQHTNIVPVHSVHTDPETGLRILCMPYFGGANLAEILESAEGLSATGRGRTGSSLIQALDRVSRQLTLESIGGGSLRIDSENRGRNSETRLEGLSESLSKPNPESLLTSGNSQYVSVPWILGRILPRRSRRYVGETAHRIDQPHVHNTSIEIERPSRRFLLGANGIQASVWVVARLAEGLAHAHARGLLHRDIKPSNILIAADGTPMLLDFNLSVVKNDSESEDLLRQAKIGGTLPYMSPEHLDAFNPRGKTSPDEVDGRSDIYALGLILFEMIAGQHPFADPPPQRSVLETIQLMFSLRLNPPSLRSLCPEVPWSLDALVAKCLDPNPGRRYSSADDLAEDLRRFLNNQSMKFCPEPSIHERLAKWAKRHPAISSSTTVGLVSLAFILVLGLSLNLLYKRVQEVSTRLRLQVFRQGFTESQFWLNPQSNRIENLKKGLALSKRTLEELGLFGRPDDVQNSWMWRLPPEEREQIGQQGVELSLLHARARVKLAESIGNERDRRVALGDAVRLIDQSRELYPEPIKAYFLERAGFLDALGESQAAEADRKEAAKIPLSTPYDYLVLGTSLLADGKAFEAEAPLKVAVDRDITSFWSWFSLGHSYYRQGRYSDAVVAFTACAVRGPKFAWAHFNLGVALAKSGRLLDAKTAYTRAIDLDSSLPEAFLNRALVELELNQLQEAKQDFEKVISEGLESGSLLSAYGETLARLGKLAEAEHYFSKAISKNPDSTGNLVARGISRLRSSPMKAGEDFARALELDPMDAVAHYGMARILRSEDPAAALSHLDLALKTDPNLLDAVQLRALLRARTADPGMIQDVEDLVQRPTPHRLYNAACALAIYAESVKDDRWLRRSYETLVRAIDMGFPKTEAQSDPDLEPLHRIPDSKSIFTVPQG